MVKIINWLIIPLIILAVSWYILSRPDNSEELKLLPHEISGTTSSTTLLVFLHGYPNTLRMWDSMINNLKGDYRILNLSYPNYSSEVHRKWGIDFPTVIKLIKLTIEHVEKNDSKTYKKSIIGHDWGAAILMLFDNENKGYASQLMTLDIGSGTYDKLATRLIVITYQTYLASAFLIGGKVGDIMTSLFVNYLGNLKMISDHDKGRINSSWNYFYYHLYRNIFHYRAILGNYVPSAPLAFIWGTQKKFMFHSDSFLEKLSNIKGCEHHSVEDGHWVMKEKNNEKFILDLIRKRN